MSLYDALGVEKDASPDEIKKAHRRKAREHHPDKPGGDKAKFQEIQLAYDTLGDDEKRQRYDQTGQTSGPESPDPATHRLAVLLDSLIEKMLEDGMPIEHADMKAHAIEAIEHKIAELKSQRGHVERALSKAHKLAKRFKRKKRAKGPDMLAGILARKERDISDAIGKVDEALGVWDRAKEILRSYDYKFEPSPAPSRSSAWTNPSFIQFDFPTR